MFNKIVIAYKKHQILYSILLIIAIISFIFILQNSTHKSSSVTTGPSVTITPTPTVNLEYVGNSNFSEQSANDFLFNQAWDKTLSQYPWYPKLPLENLQYTVVYDFEKSSFRIHVKIKSPSEDQKNQIIQIALSAMKDIGIDMSQYSYYSTTD